MLTLCSTPVKSFYTLTPLCSHKPHIYTNDDKGTKKDGGMDWVTAHNACANAPKDEGQTSPWRLCTDKEVLDDVAPLAHIRGGPAQVPGLLHGKIRRPAVLLDDLLGDQLY